MRDLLASFGDMLTGLFRSRRGLKVACALLAPGVLAAVLVCAFAPALDATDRIPVAVVNLDEGAQDDEGMTVRAGEDLVDQLEDTSILSWSFVDEQQADEGLADGSYALALKIPADYSEHIVSLSSANPSKANVEIVSTGSENVLATRAGSAALQQVQARLRADVGEDYVLSILNDVQGQASRLTLTADGSAMLDSGYDALDQGASAIADGLRKTASGAGQLGDGLNRISTGIDASASGAAALGQGIAAVRDQAAAPLAAGSEALASGLNAVASSARAMGEGAVRTGSALQGLGDSLSQSMGSVSALGLAGSKITEEGATLTESLDGAVTVLRDASGAARGAAEVAQGAQGAASEISSGSSALAHEIAGEEGQPGISAKLRAVDGRLDALRDQMRSVALDAGLEAAEREERVAALDEQAAELAAERDDLLDKLDAASDSAADLSASSSKLEAGLAGLADAGGPLADAAGALEGTRDAAAASLGRLEDAVGDAVSSSSGLAATMATAQAMLSGAPAGDSASQAPGLAASVTALGQGMNALADQLSADGELGAGVSGLATGARALGSALTPLAEATDQLATGSTALASALGGVAEGAGGLGTGISAMADATSQLGEGALQLKDASAKVIDGMSQAGDTLGDIASERADRAQVVSSPVTFTSQREEAVEPGAALAPVLVSAALMLGAPACGALLPAFDMRALAAGRGLLGTLSCGACYASAGIIQALVSLSVLAFIGVRMPDPVALAGVLVLGSLAFSLLALAIRSIAPRAFPVVFAALLVVQLMCSGAILPSSFTGGAWDALGHVLPLPVLAQALRSVLAGSSRGVGAACAVLAASCLVVCAAAWAAGRQRRRVRPERLAP